MIYARKKEKPVNVSVVPYEIEEFIYGRIDYVTDCPFEEVGRYTLNVNKVGDIGCNTCKWQVSHNRDGRKVGCSHPKEEKKETLFKL